jgi:hypothetical protein
VVRQHTTAKRKKSISQAGGAPGNGKLADHIDSTFLALTEFSPPLR